MMRALKAHSLDAWLGGKSLRDADPRIWISNIRQEIIYKTEKAESAAAEGRYLAPARRDALRVAVEFALLETREVEAREAAIEAANAWAGDGFLEITSKPGRRLRASCRERAAIRDVMNPKETFTIVFETGQSPYWEDAEETRVTLAGLSGTATARVGGAQSAWVEAEITPRGGTLGALTLTAGNTAMAFAGLSVAAGAALRVDHDEAGLLRIRCGAESKYHCRLGDSDDELACGPGQAALGFSASAECQVTFMIRGRYE